MTKPALALVTAFDAFGDDKLNASAEALKYLPEKQGTYRINKAILPTSFSRAWLVLQQAIIDMGPDIVMMLGQAGGRASLSLERCAVNIQDARIPDNDGAQPKQLPVFSDAPQQYQTAFPLDAIHAVLTSEDIPAEISQDAGRFVCNATYFQLLRYCAAVTAGSIQAGFIHLPWLPDQAAKEGSSAWMDPAVSAKAVMFALEVIRDK